MPKTVALVSVFKSGDWLENRLNNLLLAAAQTDLEIYCVNASSPDPRDAEILSRYSDKVRVEDCGYLTLYDTWNQMIQKSDSQYITNANTDDIVAPQCYKVLSDILDSKPKIGCTYPSWGNTDVANQTWPPHNSDPQGNPGQFCGDINTAQVGHFPMWRRSLHDKVGYFDVRLNALGDADFWCRCVHIGKTQFHWHTERLGLYLFRHGDNLWHRAINQEEWDLFHANYSRYKTGQL